jgi:heme/copper-type cytochrome/quinol oxidase subunit 2
MNDIDFSSLQTDIHQLEQTTRQIILALMWIGFSLILLFTITCVYVAIKTKQTEKKVDNLLEYRQMEEGE